MSDTAIRGLTALCLAGLGCGGGDSGEGEGEGGGLAVITETEASSLRLAFSCDQYGGVLHMDGSVDFDFAGSSDQSLEESSVGLFGGSGTFSGSGRHDYDNIDFTEVGYSLGSCTATFQPPMNVYDDFSSLLVDLLCTATTPDDSLVLTAYSGEYFGIEVHGVLCDDTSDGYYSLTAPLADFSIENASRTFVK
jgi:hypothetical protein